MEPMINVALRAAWAAENLINRMIDRPDLLKVANGRTRRRVTNLETGVEEAILTALRQAHPRHAFVTPESGPIQAESPESEYVWIIDPLCGVENLIRGIPHFAFSIACQFRGRTEHAVIVDPIRRERFSASRGKGAQLGDTRMRVSGRSGLEDAALGTAIGDVRDAARAARQAEIVGRVRRAGALLRESGCSALDMAYIAAGRLDGGWMTGLTANDLAAGLLLVTEAGGLTSDFEGGQEYRLTGEVVCTSPKCLKPLLQVLRPRD